MESTNRRASNMRGGGCSRNSGFTRFLMAFIAFHAIAASAWAADTVRFIRHANPIDGIYFVVFNDNVAPQDVSRFADDVVKAHGARVRMVWTHVLHGFSMTATESEALAVSNDVRVKYVEQDFETFLSTAPPHEDPTQYSPATNFDPGCAWSFLSRVAPPLASGSDQP